MVNLDDFTYFKKFVDEDNFLNIKSELSNFILLFGGDKTKIDQAINYAIGNSEFRFEENIESTPSIPLLTDEDEFIYENRQLVNNFSEKRYKEVLRLYHLVYNTTEEKKLRSEASKPYTENFEVARPVREIAESKKDDTLRNFAIIAVVGVVGYFIYKLLK